MKRASTPARGAVDDIRRRRRLQLLLSAARRRTHVKTEMRRLLTHLPKHQQRELLVEMIIEVEQ